MKIIGAISNQIQGPGDYIVETNFLKHYIIKKIRTEKKKKI